MKAILCSIIFVNTFTSVRANSDSVLAKIALHEAEQTLTRVIVSDIFSPPVASRIYTYANIAAYEAALPAYPGCHSLYQQIKNFPHIQYKKSINDVDFELASLYAFFQTGKRLVFSEDMMEDSLQVILSKYKHLPKNKFDASLKWGQTVSDSIMAWSAKDQYKETRSIKRYTLKKDEGKWIPTPPGYMSAIEPYWSKMRTLVLDSSSQFQPPSALSFSKEKGTPFYEEAYEVYKAGVSLTPLQRDIANFWDCNPFYLNISGHLNFATKKISPGGHWISITGIVTKQTNTSFIKTLATYTMVSIAMYDVFISCWDEKFRSNVIRPETYINAYIDESWKPLLQTPPFPEYTSGHSVVSAAIAVVLTEILGDNIAFVDNSEYEYGLPDRTFNSFTEAANEAAISRLYGGIHYRAAIENGKVQGEKIGRLVLKKIRLM